VAVDDVIVCASSCRIELTNGATPYPLYGVAERVITNPPTLIFGVSPELITVDEISPHAREAPAPDATENNPPLMIVAVPDVEVGNVAAVPFDPVVGAEPVLTGKFVVLFVKSKRAYDP
jgi:hypothetical protein